MANEHIQEVGVRFTAEGAAEYQRTIKDINADMSQATAEYKKTTAEMGKNATETEKLTAKAKLYNDQIKSQEEKVKVLATELDKLTNAEEKDEDAIKRKQTQLTHAETALLKYKDQLKETNAELKNHSEWTDKAAQKLQEFGGKAEAAGKKMSTAVTAPVVAIGTAAVKVAADFESAMSNVKAISGATDEELGKLTEKAREMGAKTKFSATEAADALSYMAMAGWKTGDMLDGLEGVMLLAAATGEDLSAVSDIVTDALTAFGLEAKDTSRFVDVLAAAATNSNTNVTMMGESFKYAAPVAGALGFTIEDTAIALGLMANSGIKASSAGTQLRQAFTNLVNPTDKMAAAMDKYGISATNSDGSMKSLYEIMTDLRGNMSSLTDEEKSLRLEQMLGIKSTDLASSAMEGLTAEEIQYETALGIGQKALESMTEEQYMAILASERTKEGIKNMTRENKDLVVALAYGEKQLAGLTQAEQANAASTIFGSRAMSGFLAIINASDEDFDKLTSSINGSEGAVQKMADIQMDNLSGQLVVLKSMVEELAIGFGNVLLPVIRSVVEWLQGMLGWLNSLDEGTKETIVTIAGIVAAVGPLLILIGKMSTGIGAIIKILPMLTSLTNPVILALTAASVAVALFGNESDSAKKALGAFAQDVPSLSNALSGLKPELKNVNDLLSSSGQSMSELNTSISQTEGAITDILSQALKEQRELRQADVDSIRQYMDDIAALQEEKLSIYRQNQLGELRAFELEYSEISKEEAMQRVANSQEALKQSNDAVEDAYKQRLVDIDNFHAAQGTMNTEAYQKDLQDAKLNHDQLVSENSSYHAEVLGLNAAYYAKLVNEDESTWKRIGDGQTKRKSEWESLWQEVNGENTKNLIQFALETKKYGKELDDDTKKAVSLVLDGYSSLPPALKKAGEDSLRGMIEGYDSQIPELEKAGTQSGKDLIDSVRTALDSHSPSRVMAGIGKDTVDGLKQGMNNNRSSLTSDSKSIGSSLVDGINDGIEGRQSWLGTQLSSFVNGIVKTTKSLFGIHSPSRVMADQIGEPIAEGVAVGIENASDEVDKAMEDLLPDKRTFDLTAFARTSGDFTKAFVGAANAGSFAIEQQAKREYQVQQTAQEANDGLDMSDATILKLARAIASAITGENSENGGGITISLTVGERELARALFPSLSRLFAQEQTNLSLARGGA